MEEKKEITINDVTRKLKAVYDVGTGGDLIKVILKYMEKYPDILNWKVYVEVLSSGDLRDKYRQNRENPSSWQFISYVPDGLSEIYRKEYIDVAGGIGIDTKHKAILVCINY